MHPGITIRQHREAKALTLKQLAERTGLSISYISEIEKGAKTPSLKTLAKISVGLDIPLGVLLPESNESAPPMGLGERLRLAREARGMSLAELGKQCGLSTTYLSEIERGEAKPAVQTLRKLAEALQVSLPTLLEGAENGLGDRIKSAREMMSLSRNDLAKKSGLSLSMITQLENGQTRPSLETVERIAGVLGITPCHLILGEPGLNQVLASMSEETRELLNDPQVQSVLKLVSGFSKDELTFVLRFIQLMKTNPVEEFRP